MENYSPLLATTRPPFKITYIQLMNWIVTNVKVLKNPNHFSQNRRQKLCAEAINPQNRNPYPRVGWHQWVRANGRSTIWGEGLRLGDQGVVSFVIHTRVNKSTVHAPSTVTCGNTVLLDLCMPTANICSASQLFKTHLETTLTHVTFLLSNS